MKIEIIDSGISNLASVRNILTHIGYDALIVETPVESANPDLLILPGVGAFDAGMESLHQAGWYSHLRELSASQKILGICLGMQLLCDGSEEGAKPGLGLLPGSFIKFNGKDAAFHEKIPNMGWRRVDFSPTRAGWASGLHNRNRFYFVHSYHYAHDSDEYVIGTSRYGYDFPAVIQHNNVTGFQFHPEKSHWFGMTLLKSYLGEINDH